MALSRKTLDKHAAAAGWRIERKDAGTGYLVHKPEGQGQATWAHQLIDVEATLAQAGVLPGRTYEQVDAERQAGYDKSQAAYMAERASRGL